MDKPSKMPQPTMYVPRFENEAKTLAMELAQWSPEHISEAMGCNHKIAAETVMRYQRFYELHNANGKLTPGQLITDATMAGDRQPAVLSYIGQVFRYLKADTFSETDFAYTQDHLLICSFLYGLLRPLDGILPYRLEGKVRLETTDNKTLFSFWRERLTDMLIESVRADDGILVHLAAKEMELMFDWPRVCTSVKVVQPLFYVDKGMQLKTIVVHAKTCRGVMTREILTNQYTHPESLQSFEHDGFRYRPNYGNELHPHFIKD